MGCMEAGIPQNKVLWEEGNDTTESETYFLRRQEEEMGLERISIETVCPLPLPASLNLSLSLPVLLRQLNI